ncbi:YtxH domain-containing protein [Flavobacterium croceum]|jgi:gas vesicle protein|uniref:YtxH-like protein n=1 Tax=Flavobacterium croceum DSM 17960 TaxID=1121886 RepID=A0A2S4N7K1_9FLAO|nr:YtxH domain-containing protein [Flavobacterium croceum]POS01333.1 YtxH-like protein [Flavobacterium croceum DSM 17960]
MKSSNVILGFLGGMAVGAVLGVLLAPEKGSETRKKLKEQGEDLVNNLKSNFDDLASKVASKADELLSKENVAEEVEHNLENLKNINKNIL